MYIYIYITCVRVYIYPYLYVHVCVVNAVYVVYVPFWDEFHSSDRQSLSVRPPLALQGPLLLPLTSQQALSDAALVALSPPIGPLLLPQPLKTIDFPRVFHTFHEIRHFAKKSSKVTPEQAQGHTQAAK